MLQAQALRKNVVPGGMTLPSWVNSLVVDRGREARGVVKYLLVESIIVIGEFSG